MTERRASRRREVPRVSPAGLEITTQEKTTNTPLQQKILQYETDKQSLGVKWDRASALYDLTSHQDFIKFWEIPIDEETSEAATKDEDKEEEDERISNEEVARFTELSKVAHAELLLGEANINTRLFAASDFFASYVGNALKKSGAGPLFQRTLHALSTGDEKIHGIVQNHSEQLADLDKQYFWFAKRVGREEGEPTKLGSDAMFDELFDRLDFVMRGGKSGDDFPPALRNGFTRFSEVTNDLMDTISDTNINPDWREFAINNFENLCVIISHQSRSNIETYDPADTYMRYKQFYPAIAEKSGIGSYIWLSAAFGATEMIPILDQEIADNKPERAIKAKDMIRWILLEARGGDLPERISEEEFRIYRSMLYGYAAGSVPEEDFPTFVKRSQEFILRRKNLGDTEGVSDNARRAFSEFIDDQEEVMSEFNSPEDFLKFMEQSTSLLTRGVFPTELITDYIKKQGDLGVNELLRLYEETQQGRFDINNPLQKDIEFMKFLGLLGAGDARDAYGRFQRLDLSKDGILGTEEVYEAKAAAIEAARVYWLVKDRVDKGKDVLVVGNHRNGTLFVTNILEDDLLDLDVDIDTTYARSDAGEDQSGSRFFTRAFKRSLLKTMPDIIVVDGTGTNTKDVDGQIVPRFSGAMRAFKNWASDFNAEAPKEKKYRVVYKSFIDSDTVVVGDEIVRQEKGDENDPQLFIVNSTIDPNHARNLSDALSNHKPGFFDDHDRYISSRSARSTQLFFSEHGLEVAPQVSEPRYLSAAQTAIKNFLPQAIMSPDSNPVW